MTQPPYGSSPSGQPNPQYPTSPVPGQYQPHMYSPEQSYQPNPTMPNPAMPNPAMPPQYPQIPLYQGYPGGYGTNPYGEPIKKSPVLGIVGLSIVVVCMVIYFICSLNLYNALFAAIGLDLLTSGVTDVTTMTSQLESLSDAQMYAIMGTGIGILVSSVIGIVGFILSIVATVKKMGRPFGIIGIILGIIAPLTIILAAKISVASFI